MTVLRALTALPLWVTISFASATFGHPDQGDHDPCYDVGSGADQANCFDREYQQANARVDGLVAQATSQARADTQYGPATIKKLQAAQAAWKQYRTYECVAEANQFAGRLGEDVTEEQCLARHIKSRVQELTDDYAIDLELEEAR
jgi:uncharacterized protein YecT (DUF1311 family)